ncbi:MAG: peptide chain release factor N(5)-glutamine methyltransferase [Candidatus Contendobacter sp.]
MNDSVYALLTAAAHQLASSSDTPRLDAEVLLAATLEQLRSALYAWPERRVDAEQATRFAAWLHRRQGGEPLAYLLGQREFWSLELEVTPDTLIPRPETETLVELALTRLADDAAIAIADLGTGSGAIALALAVERPRARIVATDHSAAALAVARRNAERLGLHRIVFRQGDWCAPLRRERLALIAANPPYIAATDPCWHYGALRFEPSTALVGGVDGLDAIRTIIAQAPNHLQRNGWLVLEHGYDQGEAVPTLLRQRGFQAVSDHQDAAGVSRVSCGRWPA